MRLDGEDVFSRLEKEFVRREVDQFGVASGMSRRRGVEWYRLICLAGDASPGDLGSVQVGDEAVIVIHTQNE